jgi:hypothetical protein
MLRRKKPICKAFASTIICTNFGRSWVRVFEVGSARIAEAADIKADIDTAGKRYAYWKRVQTAIWSEPTVQDSWSLSWKKEVGNVDKEVLEAKENFTDAHIAWMKSTKIE